MREVNTLLGMIVLAGPLHGITTENRAEMCQIIMSWIPETVLFCFSLIVLLFNSLGCMLGQYACPQPKKTQLN